MRKVKKVAAVIAILVISLGAFLNSGVVSRNDDSVYANLKDKYGTQEENVENVDTEKIVTEEQVVEPKADEQNIENTSKSNYIPRRKISDKALAMEKKIWNILKDNGFSDIQAAATIGNLYVESAGLDPSAIERETSVGIGLVQWSYGRRTKLEKFAKSKGKKWSDFNVQMEFFIKEVRSSEFHNPYKKTFENPYSINDATEAFCFGYERPDRDSSHIDERIDRAWDAYYRNAENAK